MEAEPFFIAMVSPEVVYVPLWGDIAAFRVSLHAHPPDGVDVHETEMPASAIPGLLNRESMVEHEDSPLVKHPGV